MNKMHADSATNFGGWVIFIADYWGNIWYYFR